MSKTPLTPTPPDSKKTKTSRVSEKYIKKIDAMGDALYPDSSALRVESPEMFARASIRVGMLSLMLVFGIFGIWSIIAPINSAAIGIGKVILDNNKKTIQHLEGGIVDTIFVREGEFVEAGQKLIKLDETTAKARFELLRKQYMTTKAVEARLTAERDKQDALVFPDDIQELEAVDPSVAEALDSQRRIFSSRKDSVSGRISILNQQRQQLKEEINGLRAQSASATSQIGLLNQEISAIAQLVASRDAPRSRLLALQRQLASLSGERGEYQSRIARAQQSIGETEIEINNVANTFLNEVVEELKETQVALSDLEERIRASEDTFNRINILAPVAGTITDLLVHTEGGVIKPGDKIADIIPSDDKLVVEAQVQPQDIDVVQKGLEASVRLSAYKARFVPPIKGIVEQISADRFDDPQRGVSYYKARVVVDGDEMKALDNVELYPGMPADVLIVTGSRTFLTYLFDPIRESFSKSFRED
jgi:HlyD family secretion protein